MASLEYLAGLFDGEGTFSLHRQKKVWANGQTVWYASPLVSISNTDKRLLDAVIDRWGRQSVLSMDRLKPQHKDRYVWYAASGDAAAVCDDLLPFLIGKKEQAFIVRSIAHINKAWRRRYKGHGQGHGCRTPEWKTWLHEMAINRVRKLNRRGSV